MKFTPVYNISQVSATEADMLIYGVIGDSWFGEGNPAKRMVTDFKALEKKYERINIRINSPGGSVWDGLPMFNAVKSSQKDTHTYVDGIAMSMGAMLLLAGKTVHAPKGSVIMLHNVSGVAFGNAMDLRQAADEMDIYDEVLGQLIADKTGESLANVKKNWMNYKDNLMSGTTAHAAKLVDVLEDYEAKDVPENISNMSPEDVVKYYTPAAQSSTKNSIETPINEETMFEGKFKALKDLTGKAAKDITAEDVLAVNNAIKDAGIEGVTFMLDSEVVALAGSDEKITGLNNQITAKDAVIAGHVGTIAANTTKIAALEAKINGGPAVAATAAAADVAAEVIGGTTKYEKTSVDAEVDKIKSQYATA